MTEDWFLVLLFGGMMIPMYILQLSFRDLVSKGSAGKLSAIGWLSHYYGHIRLAIQRFMSCVLSPFYP